MEEEKKSNNFIMKFNCYFREDCIREHGSNSYATELSAKEETREERKKRKIKKSVKGRGGQRDLFCNYSVFTFFR